MSLRIVVQPGVAWGRPYIAGKGVTTAVIYDRMMAMEYGHHIAEDYGLSDDDLREVMEFEYWCRRRGRYDAPCAERLIREHVRRVAARGGSREEMMAVPGGWPRQVWPRRKPANRPSAWLMPPTSPGEVVPCGCRDVAIGSYANAVALEPPRELGYTKPPIAVDACIAAEVQGLWALGIKTVASCCGHGVALPVISVVPEAVNAMLALGYRQQRWVRGDCDFVPKFRRPEVAERQGGSDVG